LTRRRTAAAATAALLPLVVACSGGDDKPDSSKSRAAAAASCAVVTPGVRLPQTFPEAPPPSHDPAKSYVLVMETTCGTIRADLLASEAPVTVSSIRFLAEKRYFDGSFCHRATRTPQLTIVQCGDPSGSGAGGPGYTIPEENLPTPAPGSPVASYPRGTIAMARGTDPHSTGSQFFIVVKDSMLPPSYPVFAMVTSGIEALDAVLANGIEDSDDDPTTGIDGAPRRTVYLTSVRVETEERR
jgi:peptidyl-prolyl cis-trans isomerase B (cyclophilin B)